MMFEWLTEWSCGCDGAKTGNVEKEEGDEGKMVTMGRFFQHMEPGGLSVCLSVCLVAVLTQSFFERAKKVEVFAALKVREL